MDIFVVIGKVVATVFLPLAPVFIMLLFSAWLATRKYTWPKNNSDVPEAVTVFIGALILSAYILFLIVFIPAIWWY